MSQDSSQTPNSSNSSVGSQPDSQVDDSNQWTPQVPEQFRQVDQSLPQVVAKPIVSDPTIQPTLSMPAVFEQPSDPTPEAPSALQGSRILNFLKKLIPFLNR